MSEAPKVEPMPRVIYAWDYDVFKSAWDVDPEESPPHAVKYHHDDTVTALQSKVARLEAALKRIETPEAFWVATAHVDPETYARMIFAEQVGRGKYIEDAETIAEKKTRARYERKALEKTK